MRVAILGAGSMGETHARAYDEIPDVEIGAIFARTLSRAGPLADKIGIVATTKLADILGDAGLDAVDVCLPSNVYREFVVAALAAGKHVFFARRLSPSQSRMLKP